MKRASTLEQPKYDEVNNFQSVNTFKKNLKKNKPSGWEANLENKSLKSKNTFRRDFEGNMLSDWKTRFDPPQNSFNMALWSGPPRINNSKNNLFEDSYHDPYRNDNFSNGHMNSNMEYSNSGSGNHRFNKYNKNHLRKTKLQR